MFKTITVDNGSEFLDFEGIEKSYYSKAKRTKIYYCHPYSSYERGSNENANKLIRRWFRKGSNFDRCNNDYVQYVQNWINTLPRKLFNGMCSNELFQNELKLL